MLLNLFSSGQKKISVKFQSCHLFCSYFLTLRFFYDYDDVGVFDSFYRRTALLELSFCLHKERSLRRISLWVKLFLDFNSIG